MDVPLCLPSVPLWSSKALEKYFPHFKIAAGTRLGQAAGASEARIRSRDGLDKL